MYRGRTAWVTADHALAHQILRSDDFTVTQIGGTLPGLLRWLAGKTTVKGRLHPLLPPSLLSVDPPEHTQLPQDDVVGVHHARGRRAAGTGRNRPPPDCSPRSLAESPDGVSRHRRSAIARSCR